MRQNINIQVGQIRRSKWAKPEYRTQLGSLGFDFNNSEVFKLTWEMNQYGPVDKEEPANWSYLTGIAGLSDTDKEGLCAALSGSPKPVVLYVSRMWVIRSGKFSSEKASKIAAGASVKNPIVEGNTAWTFDNSTGDKKEVLERVIAVGGVLLDFPENARFLDRRS